MHPWLTHNPPVSMYGVCLVAGIVLGWIVARLRATAFGLESSRIDLMVPFAVVGGVLGAWAFGRWTDTLTGQPVQAAVLVGAMVGATAVGIGYAASMRMPMGRLADACAPAAMLVVMAGRIGCFFAGCCYGKACEPFGVQFPQGSPAFFDAFTAGTVSSTDPATPRLFPVQLIEAASCLLLAAFLIWISRPSRRAGTVTGTTFLVMAAAYAGLRFTLEFARGDNPALAGGWTFSQWACGVIFLAAVMTAVLRRRYALRWNLHYPKTPLPEGARPDLVERAPANPLSTSQG